MSKLHLDKGRVIQKLKTREALISKANELLVNGNLLNIEQAAKEAGISKATAYRYFANLETLKREASLQLKAENPEQLFKDMPDQPLENRLERLIDYHFNLFIENEQEFRLFLSSVIKESLTHKNTDTRGGRRIALITEAITPLNKALSKKEFNRRVNALSLVFGIESITILKDVCKLNNNEILENWRWMVAKIVG